MRNEDGKYVGREYKRKDVVVRTMRAQIGAM